MAEPSSKLSLKLVIDKKSNKVLFAEAGKEAVDFICSILTLPVGTVTKLLGTVTKLLSEEGMVGCLSELYKSVENLNDNYVQPDQHKDTVLQPRVSNATEEASLFKLTNLPYKKAETPKLYKCNSNHYHVTNTPGSECLSCIYGMNSAVTFVEGNKSAVPVRSVGGFVKGTVSYMLMDDLAISPTSAVAVVSLLNKVNVDVKSVEEKVVDLDMDKGLKLLKKSFESKKVLTEVFLHGQGQGNGSGSGACAVSMYRPF